MSKFLVVSHTHGLLPFGHRLQREGHTVQPIVVIKQFESAWHGKLKPSPRDSKSLLSEDFIQETFTQARSEGWTVLTDSFQLEKRLREEFKIPPSHLYGRLRFPDEPSSILRVGGWFDGDRMGHLFGLIVERGAWHGGMGPDIDGSLTLIRIDNLKAKSLMESIIQKEVDELKSLDFRGLVQFGLEFQTETGSPQVSGVGAGWPSLVTHGFLSETDNFEGLLLGGMDLPEPSQQSLQQSLTQQSQNADKFLAKKFVTVLPVSRPPWPTAKARFRFSTDPVEGLTPQQMGRVFWHDVQVDQEAGQLRTAGLDGLIGVVRGAADTSQLSLALALETATRLQIPEKQFRTDAGQQVQNTLAQLEQKFELVL